MGCYFLLQGSSWPRNPTQCFLKWQVDSLALRHVTCIYILDSLVRDSRKNNNPIAKSIPVLSSVVFKCHGGSEVKASAWNGGDLGLIPGSGRSPGVEFIQSTAPGGTALSASQISSLNRWRLSGQVVRDQT